MAEELQPDVIRMDMKIPELNGIEATRQIVHTSLYIQVLAVTMFEESQSVFAAMRAGARGFCLEPCLWVPGVHYSQLASSALGG